MVSAQQQREGLFFLPQSEPSDEKRDTKRRDFLADVEGVDNLSNAPRIGRRDKRDGENGSRLQGGDTPFLDLGEDHGILRIIGDKLDYERVVVCSTASILPCQYCGSDTGLVELALEVA